MRRSLLLMLVLLMPAIGSAAPPAFSGATANYKSWVRAELPGNAEGLVFGKDGTLYATLWQSGRVVALDGKKGSRTIGFVPDEQLGKDGITTGAELGPDGQLYVAYMWHYSAQEEMDPKHMGCRNSQDIYTGIYRIDVKTGQAAPFLTKRDGWPACFPDDIAFDAQGNLYVTDLSLSGLWKISPQGKFELWSTDPLLQWSEAPYSGYPEGANDVVMAPDGHSLIVVTDGNPAIVKVPIRADGTAGAASIIARDLSLLDGVELDERGNIYISEPYRNEISVFSPDGSERIVIGTADTMVLSGPTSLSLHDGVLCVANSGMGPKEVTEARTVSCVSGFRRPGDKR